VPAQDGDTPRVVAKENEATRSWSRQWSVVLIHTP
jgi:hypothetical protein